jgi:dTDP-glucose pyrophosphorylase
VTDVGDVLIREGGSVRDALAVLTRSGKQIALVVDGEGRLAGVVTDGDLRRALLRGLSLQSKVDEAMNRAPLVAAPGISAAEALSLMRGRGLRHLPLVDAGRKVVGLLRQEELLEPAPLPTCAVIMAGGEGKRLRPLTDATPKPLLSVGGKPILEILIERLRQSGVRDVVLALHHKSDMIRDHFGDGARLGVRMSFVLEPEPRGTMGALTLLPSRPAAPFFVINSDILTKCDFRAMWAQHAGEPDTAMTVGVSLHQVDLPYGEFTLRDGRVLTVEEKPRKEYPINAGIYVLSPAAVDLVPRDRYFDATDLIRAALDGGVPVKAYLIREYWLDVGRHFDLEKANRDVAEGLFE